MRWFYLVAILAILAANCSKPTIRELDGKIKGKASLRLADGSTISRDDSEEYRPQIVTLSDGYLVLAFGSDRYDVDCTPGTHNIFVAKSLTAYDGIFLPFFDTPRPIKNEGSCVNDPGRINFALVPDGTGVKVYLNFHSQSNQIWVAPVTDLANPAPAFGGISNSNHIDNTVIAANAAGDRLVTTDFSGIAYVINPDVDIAADAYGFGLDYAESALQVRQEVSGYDDAYIASIYGSSLATTGSFPFGPIIDLDFSLIGNGLYLSSLGAFYSNDAYGDLVLFSAYGEFSEDMYVVTSHTAGDLWNLVGFFGTDSFLPPAPTPDHWYDFESTCGTDVGTPGGWAGSCSALTTESTNSLNGSTYASLGGSDYIDLNPQTLPADFTLSAWVYIPNTSTGDQTIIANVTSTANESGFRLYVDTTDNMRLKLALADGSTTVTIASYPDFIVADTWHHVAVAVNPTFTSAYLYIDGALVNESLFSWAPTISTFNTTSADIFWGGLVGGGSGLTGYLENLRIHLRELSPPEVLAEMLEF